MSSLPPLRRRFCKWQGPFAPRTLLRFIATADPAATLSSSADFPVSPVIRPTLLRRFLAGTRRASPVARHVLATVLSLPPRRSEGAASIRFRLPCCLRPPVGGSAFGATHFRGHFCVHCCYGPVTRRLPTGDVVDRLKSWFPATLLSKLRGLFAPAGLSPAEHASPHWTHNRTGRFPASGSRTRPHAVFRVRRHRQLLNIMRS